MSHALKATCEKECRESPNVEPCEKRCQNKGIKDCVKTLKEMTQDDPSIMMRSNAKICHAMNKYNPKLQLGQDDWMVQSVCSQALTRIPHSGVQAKSGEQDEFFLEFCTLGMLGRSPSTDSGPAH
jgi:hypothetical protein